MKRVIGLSNGKNDELFGSNFTKNEILGINAMWNIRGGDGGDSVIIIPRPPVDPDEPENP